MSSKSVKRLQRYGDLTFFFKMAAVRYLGFVGRPLGHPRWLLGGLYRCAKLGWNRCNSFDNMKLSIFYPFGLKTPSNAPKIGVFGPSGDFTPKIGSSINETPKKAHPCVSPRRLSHQAWTISDTYGHRSNMLIVALDSVSVCLCSSQAGIVSTHGWTNWVDFVLFSVQP